MPVPAAAAIIALTGGSLAGAIWMSLVPVPGAGLRQASLDAWRAVLSDPAFHDALWLSARVTALATLLSVVLAVFLALGLRHHGALLRSLVALPVPVPHLLVAIVAVLWLGPGGLAERTLGVLPVELVRDRQGLGIVLVYLYKETPFLVLLALAAMGTTLHDREEAAAVLGAGALQRLRWVVWPAIRAPLGVGALIVAAFVFGAFEVPLLIGPTYPSMLATYAFDATQTADLAGQAQAAASLLVATGASIVLALVTVRVAGRSYGD